MPVILSSLGLVVWLVLVALLPKVDWSLLWRKLK